MPNKLQLVCMVWGMIGFQLGANLTQNFPGTIYEPRAINVSNSEAFLAHASDELS
jgi:hypothetical protein